MQQRHRGDAVNAALLTVAGSIALLQCGALPFITRLNVPGAVLFVTVVAATAPLHYGLMHETIHGHLFGEENHNRRAGRILGVLLGLPWETMRFGHLAHHSQNRHSFDRPEVLQPGQARLAAVGLYYFKLLIGHALSYALVPLVVLLPVDTTRAVIHWMDSDPESAPLRATALRVFTNMKRRNAVRLDLGAIFALFCFALWLWSSAWPVFACCVAARWSVLSLLDNAPHYGMPLDSGLDARNTSLPSFAGVLVMNGNLHGTHHHAPQLRWHELPAAFARSGAAPEGNWVVALLRQFRGPMHLEKA
ncbi:MAG TPA: fatty acid desaturase [Rhizomicrobium sp.]|nr:fatty acid desaturase [Rhizomicrobium sp.]